MSDTERMTDERLEEIRTLDCGLLAAPYVADLLAEVDRLRAKYEPPDDTVVPAVSGTYDHATGTLRVTLATWLQYGPNWMRGGLIQRVELTDKAPGFDPDGELSGAWWCVPRNQPPLLDCDELPPQLFERLGASDFGNENQVAWRQYNSNERAIDDLSQALIAWAREQPE